MRVRRDKNLEKILDVDPLVISKFPFKLKQDTIIELGSGKGTMISALALKNPSQNYLCVERDRTIASKAIEKFNDLNLKNINLIVSDIQHLTEIIENKVNTIWLTFSDPWPKNRHEHRRLTYKTFLDLYKKFLSPQGVIKLKTDNDKFFHYSLESMSEFGMKILYQTNDLHNSIKNLDNEMTDYEKKWSSLGKSINYLEASF
ncbi:tRNA (guanosine(46)-N7)-methyltransferase TrmB [[Mycoplasma] mobile]|uniref:tRNA (guanine-N(7)-)-methyltransferase n=1 Tax=Mycoplasma mobile (strain ATCC 43663 / 163K / NCTC 11711) TaxID=267748 RepID=TRMB_MYCM1|nr:tRNA (guanosine(46)-N7)-methyltransferase TrmB [[Mycoplasma] mobile]Q6KHE8.1 RecName: Full=tRNA (guanine-N(7)-)-methyltransferase; AltName: Full=tRNA (guanine(46)-N(7))-methyltransferase; AltName: Full=tRNA(m7G46)-methyltransferase [Mycoplasma mobile 163K]AAT27982.1 predicted S-adenosylmethionine-dependent methyltransferase [Mycoplasma mobile 163K]